MGLGDNAQVNFMILFTTLIRKLLTYAGSSSLFLLWTFSPTPMSWFPRMLLSVA